MVLSQGGLSLTIGDVLIGPGTMVFSQGIRNYFGTIFLRGKNPLKNRGGTLNDKATKADCAI